MTKNLGSSISTSDSNNMIKTIVIIIIVVVIAYLIYYLYTQSTSNNNLPMEQPKQMPVHVRSEKYSNVHQESSNQQVGVSTTTTSMNKNPTSDEMMEHFSQDPNYAQQRTQNSFPKDQLTADELLPQDNSSLWAQVNPSGEGSLKDRNFLQSGYHIGINTVGQTLRNANLQLRSEPPCPQVKVSPWLQATIEPDLGRKPFEIGGCA
jgi:ABC-type maltose transport system permease subunit